MSGVSRSLRACVAGPSCLGRPSVARRVLLPLGAQPSRSLSSSPRRSQDTPKTFSLQADLPRLPVPDLNETLDAYVKSLLPVLEQKYGVSQLKNEVEKRRLFARDFAAEGGLGRVLQERLKDLDETSENNWLNDTLWVPLAYHTWRAPMIVNASWWLMFQPDPSDPHTPSLPDHDPQTPSEAGSQGGGDAWLAENELDEKKRWEDGLRREQVSGWQIRKAAWLVRRMAEYRKMVVNEEIPPEMPRGYALDMEQYKMLFNRARIPGQGQDAFSRSRLEATHITVLIDDLVYAVDVFDGPGGEPLAPVEIEQRIKAAVEDAKGRPKKDQVAVGLLTAGDRDVWTQSRELLLRMSPTNRATLESITSSLLCLSLDTYTLPSRPSSDPLALPSVDAHLRNAFTGVHGGRNRWYDKIMSLVIETSGRAGYMGEHSAAEATFPGKATEYVLAEPVDVDAFESSSTAGEVIGWKRCDWVVDQTIREEIKQCQAKNDALVSNSDAQMMYWQEFGSDWIKNTAKMSPDAFIQQAIQLAWTRDRGEPTATYETASMRRFKHGRTDTIRSLTKESRDFVKSMLDGQVDDGKRLQRLREACSAHSNLAARAQGGHGIDRHLMGLKTRLIGNEAHPLFEDEMYGKSQEWKLSSSGMGGGEKWMGTGFGAAWDDGYGICYLIGPNIVKFGIESKWASEKTSTQRFKHRLVQALRDMRRIIEQQ